MDLPSAVVIDKILPEHLSNILTAVVVIGFGLASLAADARSRATQMLCLGLVMQGLTMASGTLKFVYTGDDMPAPMRLLGLTEAIGFASWLQWTLLVTRSSHPGRRALAWATACCRTVQTLAAIYGVVALCLPAARLHFLGAGDLAHVMVWPLSIFSGLWLTMVAISLLPPMILLSQDLDVVERNRLYGVLAAVPLMILSVFLTPDWSALSMLVGLVFFIFGALQYHVAQGQRGVFMSRFLSPAVAAMVARRGIDYTMRPRALEATVVSCDLRGFTRFSKLTPSAPLVRMMSEYYDVVGAAVQRHCATIKDYAGDGVLMLVGAPLPVADSAAVGVRLAQDIRSTTRELLLRWQRDDAPLGLGIGVATGTITVGALGSESRLEYMAIGDAVNLAARFGSLARDGEIWIDQRTRDLANPTSDFRFATVPVKGFGEVGCHIDEVPEPVNANGIERPMQLASAAG